MRRERTLMSVPNRFGIRCAIRHRRAERFFLGRKYTDIYDYELVT
jgi:hypothetical protein